MKSFNTPTAIILWPKSSPVIEMVNTILYEHFPFEADPAGVPDELKGATCVEIDSGIVRSFVEPSVSRSNWLDPLEEQDLVLITDDSSATTYRECCDLLNLVCPVRTANVVTFAVQPNVNLEASFRVSVAVASERELDGLDSRVDLYQGGKIPGPAGVMLGVAAELDQSAFCIVIEYAPDAQFVSSSAIKAALLAFSRVTAIEIFRGQMSEQAIRIGKHIKQVAEERNRESQATASLAGEKGSYFESALSIEDELRRAENTEWIEKLFDGIGDGKDDLDHSRKVFLKSELIRLGLFKRFEKRFLDLWSQSPTNNLKLGEE